MPKILRVVVPDVPHHLTQRGNRRQTIFFGASDYADYVDLLSTHCRDAGVGIWAWCLMPNHVHLIVVPPNPSALGKAIGDANRRYSWQINRREGWRGSLWQGRFGSCPMDEPHTLMAMRYVEQNPVRARMVERPEQWPWSSARAHLGLGTDALTDRAAVTDLVTDWANYLNDMPPSWQADQLRRYTGSGRPLGERTFVKKAENTLGRQIARRARRARLEEPAPS